MVEKRTAAAAPTPPVAGVLGPGRGVDGRRDPETVLGRDRGRLGRNRLRQAGCRCASRRRRDAEPVERRRARQGLLRRGRSRRARRQARGCRRISSVRRWRTPSSRPPVPSGSTSNSSGRRSATRQPEQCNVEAAVAHYLGALSIVDGAPAGCFAGNTDPDPDRRTLRDEAAARLKAKIDAVRVAPPPPPPPVAEPPPPPPPPPRRRDPHRSNRIRDCDSTRAPAIRWNSCNRFCATRQRLRTRPRAEGAA